MNSDSKNEFFFSTFELIAFIKNIKQSIREYIVQFWFYVPNIKSFSLISKHTPHTFDNHRKNINAGFVKPTL